jgi:hypothetical protein
MTNFKLGRGYQYNNLNTHGIYGDLNIPQGFDGYGTPGPQGTPGEPGFVWMPYIPIEEYQSDFIKMMNKLIEENDTNR